LQVGSLYNVKVIDLVGLNALPMLVTLSPALAMAVPTVPVVGLALVVMVGLAWLSVTA
jgi:hypothetical protein